MNGEINWQHVITEGLVYLIPTFLGGYWAFRKLMWILGEYRPHLHEEKDGPLGAEGIRYPRTLNGQK